jgi:hypothetical protein
MNLVTLIPKEKRQYPKTNFKQVAFSDMIMVDYNHSKKVKIERNKTFQRVLERKKISFEIFNHITQFLIISKKTAIGKVQLKLDGLLTRCEVHEIADVMDIKNPRKATGSKLEIKLRLRTPLLKPEITQKHERWVQIDFSNQVAGSSVSERSNIPKTTAEVKVPSPNPSSSLNPKVEVAKTSPSSSRSPSPSPQNAEENSEEIEEMILQFKK